MQAKSGGRAQRGQAIVEMAVIMPLVIFGLTAAVDMGRYMAVQSTAASAVDFAARYYESEPSTGEAAMQELVRQSYPALGDAEVHVTALGRVDESMGHKLYDAATDTFKSRPSKVATDRYRVVVEASGSWMSPGLMAAAAVSGAGGTFKVSSGAVANVDATLEEW